MLQLANICRSRCRLSPICYNSKPDFERFYFWSLVFFLLETEIGPAYEWEWPTSSSIFVALIASIQKQVFKERLWSLAKCSNQWPRVCTVVSSYLLCIHIRMLKAHFKTFLTVAITFIIHEMCQIRTKMLFKFQFDIYIKKIGQKNRTKM